MDGTSDDKARAGWSYSGEVWTDADGRAIVVLPSFVRAYRAGFDYELTPVACSATVAEEIVGRPFHDRHRRAAREGGLARDRARGETAMTVRMRGAKAPATTVSTTNRFHREVNTMKKHRLILLLLVLGTTLLGPPAALLPLKGPGPAAAQDPIRACDEFAFRVDC